MHISMRTLGGFGRLADGLGPDARVSVYGVQADLDPQPTVWDSTCAYFIANMDACRRGRLADSLGLDVRVFPWGVECLAGGLGPDVHIRLSGFHSDLDVKSTLCDPACR